MFRNDVKYQYILILIILSLFTALLINDVTVRQAQTGGDDGPIAISYYVKYPENFKTDVYMKTWQYTSLASMINWLPAILFKELDFPPEFSATILIFLQNILLGFAMFRYARVVTKRWDIAWLSICFTIIAKPYTWNLGIFGDVMWMPYAGHLALPFIIFAVSYTVENKFMKSLFPLIIAVLIHPAYSLFTIFMIGGFWLWQNRGKYFTRDLFIKLFLLSIAVVLCVLPSQILVLNIESVANSELLPAILRNGHTFPWKVTNCANCLPSFISNFVYIILFISLVLLALKKDNINKNAITFWKVSLLSSIVLCLIHFSAAYFNSILLLRLIATRSTLLLMMFSVPIVLTLIVKKLNIKNIVILFCIAYFLLLPSILTMLAVLIISISTENGKLLNIQIKQKNKECVRVVGYVIVLFVLLIPRFEETILAFNNSLVNASYNFIFHYFHSDRWFIPFLAFFIAFMWTIQGSGWIMNLISRLHNVSLRMFSIVKRDIYENSEKQKLNYIPITATIFIMSMVCIITGYTTGKYYMTAEDRALVSAQLWAKKSTVSDASFITEGISRWVSWRTVSLRPVVYPTKIGGYYFYPKFAQIYNDELIEFYSRHFAVTPDSVSKKGLARCFYELDEKGLSEFNRNFGGDYLVRKTSDDSLSLPVVYHNEYFIIYRLKQN